MDIYGTYEHTIDVKGRLVLPSACRSTFAEGGIAALVEDYAALFTSAEWDLYRLRLEDSGIFTRDELLTLVSYVAPFTPAAQNRICLPQRLRDRTELGRDVTLVGSIRYFAVFSNEEWARREAAVEAKAETGPSIADKFRSLEFL